MACICTEGLNRELARAVVQQPPASRGWEHADLELVLIPRSLFDKAALPPWQDEGAMAPQVLCLLCHPRLQTPLFLYPPLQAVGMWLECTFFFNHLCNRQRCLQAAFVGILPVTAVGANGAAGLLLSVSNLGFMPVSSSNSDEPTQATASGASPTNHIKAYRGPQKVTNLLKLCIWQMAAGMAQHQHFCHRDLEASVRQQTACSACGCHLVVLSTFLWGGKQVWCRKLSLVEYFQELIIIKEQNREDRLLIQSQLVSWTP